MAYRESLLGNLRIIVIYLLKLLLEINYLTVKSTFPELFLSIGIDLHFHGC